jgi:transcription antitermination protein NusB
MSDLPDFDANGDEVVNREVVQHDIPTTDRSAARRVALQALYEIDVTSHGVGEVLEHHLALNAEEVKEHQLSFHTDQRKVRSYIIHLVEGIMRHHATLDAILQQYAPEWPIHQVAVVDRNILRIALYELGIDRRIPVGVAIDEAIELAKLFGAENTPRFINGVLGTVADNLDSVRALLVQEEPPDAVE